jgi:hypothetical protein
MSPCANTHHEHMFVDSRNIASSAFVTPHARLYHQLIKKKGNVNAFAMTTEEQQRTVPPGSYYKVRSFSASSCLADVGTSILVGLTIAMPVSVIDYSIMAKIREQTDSSVKELKRGLGTLVTKPNKFFLKCPDNHYATVYRAVAIVYGFTYFFANLTRSYCDSLGLSKDAVNFSTSVASAVVNIGLTVWKDGVILKVFPPKDPREMAIAKAPVPLFSKFLFASRDFATVLAAFTVAPLVAEYLAKRYRPEQLPLGASDCAQIVTPAALQFGTTILHIVGVKYQGTGGKLSLQEASLALKKDYIMSTLLRISRIVPAFGIGGIGNRNLRNTMMLSIADKDQPSPNK